MKINNGTGMNMKYLMQLELIINQIDFTNQVLSNHETVSIFLISEKDTEVILRM